jgi:hypothetical protein
MGGQFVITHLLLFLWFYCKHGHRRDRSIHAPNFGRPPIFCTIVVFSFSFSSPGPGDNSLVVVRLIGKNLYVFAQMRRQPQVGAGEAVVFVKYCFCHQYKTIKHLLFNCKFVSSILSVIQVIFNLYLPHNAFPFGNSLRIMNYNYKIFIKVEGLRKLTFDFGCMCSFYHKYGFLISDIILATANNIKRHTVDLLNF